MKRKRIKSIFKNRILKFLLFIIASAGVGFLIAFLSAGILEDFFKEYIHSDKFYIEIFNMALMLLVFFIGFFLHIIIHEGGHLVFGLLSGYEFVSFRVLSFIIIKDNSGYKFKRYNIPGTGGQCLMMPPEKTNGSFPFIIYNLGGALLNTIVSLVTIWMASFLKDFILLHGILIIISGAGLFAAITNALPLKVGGMSNDGHNIITMLRDENSKESFYLQLRVNGLQSKGIRLKDMPYEQFKLKKDIDYKKPLNFSRIFINHNYYLDSMNFKEAQAALDFGRKYVHSTIGIYQMEMASELLFLELIGDCDDLKIEELYNKNLKKYIKDSKFMINKKRIMMAYEIFYKKDKEKARKYFQELKELAINYPIKAEADMELMIGEYLNKKI